MNQIEKEIEEITKLIEFQIKCERLAEELKELATAKWKIVQIRSSDIQRESCMTPLRNFKNIQYEELITLVVSGDVDE